LARLRAAYDADAQRITQALRQVFDGRTNSDPVSARTGVNELEAAIQSATATVTVALELLRAQRPPRRRRLAKAATRTRRQSERFWTRQLMQLVELRTRLSWLALDTPGLLVPKPLVSGVGSFPGAAQPP